MKGIYLGAYKAFHPNYDIIYQDINGKRDLNGDMMQVDLSKYNYVIATPPCNYWSRANGNKPSNYALKTAHLLPDIIKKLRSSYFDPWIVENVRNDKKFYKYGLLNFNDVWVYRIGRHTYWTNTPFYTWIEQNYEYKLMPGRHCKRISNDSNKQGGDNVHKVIESWLKTIHENKI